MRIFQLAALSWLVIWSDQGQLGKLRSAYCGKLFYFNSVFGRSVSEPPPPGIHPIVPHLSNDLSVITFSTDDVYKVLSTLNPLNSPGPDEVTSRLLKDLALELAGPLTCLFNKSLASGQFPDK